MAERDGGGPAVAPAGQGVAVSQRGRSAGVRPRRAKRSGKPTHAEARAACMRVMEEMFDLRAVLRGQKPVSQLAGLAPLAGWLTTVGVSMVVTLLNDRTMQRLQRSLYLRNFGVFARDMALRICAVIADISLQSTQQYFRVRVAYAWRKQLQDKLHATYFRDMTYYRQTTWEDSISDPGQRITRDIGNLAFQLRIFCTSSVNETLRSIQTATRIWFALPNERWLIPLIVVWSWTNLAIRNWIAPALERGMLMAKINRCEGAFRDAYSKLAQHAESIICFDGVSAEAKRLQVRLDERLGQSQQMMMFGMRERASMEILGMIVSQTLTSCLVQVPMLSQSYHLKVSPTASEQLRMQANANMLAAMTFNEQLVRSLQSNVGHLSRLGRDVMNVSGSAIRIAELLDLVDSAESELRHPTADGAVYFREVDVETPTGVRLVDHLSFTVAKGENMMLTGANGCGKTSILRTLKGLWRPAAGTAGFPRDTIFLPQSPYCPIGSLQDQLSYPDTLEHSISTEDLRQHLSKVNLAHLVDKELDDPSSDWNLLSLAEKQLLGVARVLFKSPTFAVLDEATSAVDAEIEAQLFEQLSRSGITLITVTHRASLLQFHENLLKIAAGEHHSWSLKSIEAGDESGLASPRLTPVRAARQPGMDADVARHLAARSKKEAAESMAQRPMPEMSDVQKTCMILKLCVPSLSLTDATVVRLVVFVVLMSAGVWIQTGFLSSSYGVLKALTMESNTEKYVRFQLQIAGMRVLGLGVSLLQQWVQSGVSIEWRRRIIEAITSRYLADCNFYTMRHVDRRITDVDNRVTTEVTQLVSSISQMTWMILRPMFDAVYCTLLLIRARLPPVALLTMFGYGVGGVSLIRLIAPDFKKMTQEKERVQAELRSAHERVEQNTEAIAFQDGDHAEERIANKASDSVMAFLHRENKQNACWSAFNSFMMWRLTYYIQMSLQFYWSLGQGTDADVLANRGGVQMAETSSYIGSLIQRSFSSLSSLLTMWGGHQQGGGQQQGPSGIAGLLGSSRRVAEVLIVLDDLDQQREMRASRLTESELPATPRRGERICLSDASINSPDGKCLASELTFSVEGQCGDEMSSLIITGKTGSGKSSVARVLHGIWQPGSGRVGIPSGLATIPQSPLVPTDSLTLMGMLTYPNEIEAGTDEADVAATVLLPLMQRLRVAYLVERNEQGWHAIKDWPTVLSLGEQQCLGVIRVMYHGCQWLLLDEAMSAMGEDVAAECYGMFKERGIRYVTATQDADPYRAFHSQELRVGEPNQQGWTLEQIFHLDAPRFGLNEDEEPKLVLSIPPDSSEGQMESGSDAGGSDRL